MAITIPTNAHRELMPAPRLDTESVETYILNKFDVQLVVRELHKQSLWENVKTQIFGPPGGQVLSLMWIPMLRLRMNDLSELAKTSITVGTQEIGVEGRRSDTEVVHIKYGSFFLDAAQQLPRNWIAYKSRYKAYLPMVGTVDIDPADIFANNVDEDKTVPSDSGKVRPLWADGENGTSPQITVSYFVNLTNGRATCYLSSTKPRINLDTITGEDGKYTEVEWGQNAFFAQDCAWGYDIPLAVESNRTGPLAALRQLTKGIVGGGESEDYTVGSISGDQTLTADMNPRLWVYMPEPVLSDEEHAAYYGIPAGGKRVRVRECEGFMQIREILDEVMPDAIPIRHYEELASLLKEGVYI